MVIHLLILLALSSNCATDTEQSYRNDAELLSPHSRNLRCCLYISSLKVDNITGLDHLLSTFGSCKKFLKLSNSSMYHYIKILTKELYHLQIDETCIKNHEPICHQKTTPTYLVYAILLFLILILALTGNLAVIFVYRASRTLRRHVTYLFVNSLALSDFLVATFIIPIKLMQAFNNWHFCSVKFVCQLYFTADVLFFTASITNILSVTIDRFIAILFPFKYTDILTLFRVRVWVVSVWVYAIIWAIFIHWNYGSGAMDNIDLAEGYCGHKSDNYFIVLYMVVFILPCSTIGIIYANVYVITSSHWKSIRQQNILGHISPVAALEDFPDQQDANAHNNLVRNVADSISSAARKVHWRLARVLFIVYGSFVMCWLPLILVFFLKKYSNMDPPLHARLIFIDILPIFKSTCNPFIYSVMHRDFRKELKRVIISRVCPNVFTKTTSRRESQEILSCTRSRKLSDLGRIFVVNQTRGSVEVTIQSRD